MRRKQSRFICAAAAALGQWWAWSAAGSSARAADLRSVYIGAVEAREAWICWGVTGPGGNTIGRASKPLGEAAVEIGGKTHRTKQNWMHVTGLEPDTRYPFRVLVNSKPFGEGALRTHPERAARLRFFVMGDYGSGAPPQFKIAEAMEKEFEKHESSNNPVRFLLTTGDNIYGAHFGVYVRNSGDKDRHWQTKFFQPYARLLARIPFYPTLGNHDGDESENRGDLEVYMDNFAFPGFQPARWYQFRYANLAEFFALDSTENGLRKKKAWQPGGEQEKWFQRHLAESRAPWKIAIWHHPPFTAGPRHEASLEWMRSAVDLASRHGVQAVFNGHEHNLQIVKRSGETGGVQYVVSGSAGELRAHPVQKRLEASNIAAWSPQWQFLSIEIDGGEMRIQPISFEPIRAVTESGEAFPFPLIVRRGE